MAFRGQEAVAVSFAHDTCHKCLLFYPRSSRRRPGHIVQIPNFIPLICREGSDEGLHLHIAGGHQRTGSLTQVDGLVPLVHVECQGRCQRREVYRQSRLRLQRRLQLGRQGLAPLPGPPKDTQAGFPAQIVFSGR